MTLPALLLANAVASLNLVFVTGLVATRSWISALELAAGPCLGGCPVVIAVVPATLFAWGLSNVVPAKLRLAIRIAPMGIVAVLAAWVAWSTTRPQAVLGCLGPRETRLEQNLRDARVLDFRRYQRTTPGGISWTVVVFALPPADMEVLLAAGGFRALPEENHWDDGEWQFVRGLPSRVQAPPISSWAVSGDAFFELDAIGRTADASVFVGVCFNQS